MAAKRKAGRARKGKAGAEAVPDAEPLVLVRKDGKVGRPSLEITDKGWSVVEEMARDLCTQQEIADYLGIGLRTLQQPHLRERFEKIITTRRAASLWKVRARQLERAVSGNPVDSIWFGKQHLGQTDKQAITGGDSGPLELIVTASETLEEILDRLDKSKGSE